VESGQFGGKKKALKNQTKMRVLLQSLWLLWILHVYDNFEMLYLRNQ